jgi:mannose-6-phosphate isomerase-like protein (cupin superfamily)
VLFGGVVAEIFQPGDSPPAWCELKDFKLLTFEGLSAIELRRRRPRERLIITAASAQISFSGRSQVLSERQFFDLPDGVSEYVITPVRAGANAVLLMGAWGDELGGCGVFTARNEESPSDRGDPVDYEKHTSVDSHYHDCDEYWIGLEGRGEAIVGGRRIPLGAGECVPIRTGHHHDLPNAPEGIRAVFFETTLIGKKRVGHLWEHAHGPATPLPE